jgi:hypothetical protein
MTFIVNGADWHFDGMITAEVEDVIEKLLDFVAISDDRSEAVQIGDDFQSRPMYNQLTLWEMLSDIGLGLNGNLRQEMAAWLWNTKYYADANEWPVGADDWSITIDGANPVDNADAAWVHHCVRAGIPAACLTLGQASVVQTTSKAGTASVHFVSDEFSRRRFWREMILLEGDDAASLARNATHAYPDLYFVDGVLRRVDDLEGGYLASRERVRNALAVLDKWGRWVFTYPPPALSPGEGAPPDPDAQPTKQLVQRRFTGLHLSVAPENPNVHGHRASREARTTVVGNRTLYCEWHIKLEPHRNRIHVHAPVQESDYKVVIGMINSHLPLPP